MQKPNQIRFFTIAVIIVLAAMSRMVGPWFYGEANNFAPIGAIALFGGAYYGLRWTAFAIPIAALWFSNCFANHFYSGNFTPFYSGSFLRQDITFFVSVLLGATALIGGVYFGLRKAAFAILFAALWFIGCLASYFYFGKFTPYFPDSLWQQDIAFCVSVLLGALLLKNVRSGQIGSAAVVRSEPDRDSKNVGPAKAALLQLANFLGRLVGVCLLASVTFFVISNFAVWAGGTMYPKTMAGLVQCYTMAIPFFKGTLLGDLFYSLILFGSFEMAKLKFPVLVREKLPAPAAA